jgi:serine/threonine-protein kinase
MPPDPVQTPAAIGQYPVERELGRGGMGVVYLARDPRLNRPVAIKVLPAAFVADPVRLQRFEREARTLAALNHRHVGMIFGLEDDPAGGGRLLVLEFIPGQTLTAMLARGPLGTDEAARIGLQIAEGLEAAHEQGVVHRDLKPDNVRVTPDGVVKILDFGLASAGADGAHHAGTHHAGGLSAASAAAANMGLTLEGAVMGTPGYMSPEQARGQPTDKRTDVWAFGCVLYECLTGYKAFGGETVGDCLAAVLEREPDYTLLPARTPGRLRELMHRCLVKDPRRRLRDIGDARIQLEDVLTGPQSGWYQAVGGPGRAAGPARLAMPLSAAPGGAELALANTPRGSLAVAPDGSAVALVAARGAGGGGAAGGPPSLYVRRMDGHEARVVPSTAGAEAPFFSPDGSRLGFFADGKLKRVALTGGAPVALCPAPRPQGGCWGEDDHVYFVPDWGRGLWRIPGSAAPGAQPEPVAEPDPAAGELALLAPDLLPGGRHALVCVWTGAAGAGAAGGSGAPGDGGYDGALISAVDLRTRARKPLIHGGCNPRYIASGHIVFSRGGALLAVAFDPQRLEVFGAPTPVEDRVMGHALGGGSQFAAGDEGTLVVARGPVWEPRRGLALAGRGAEPTPLALEPRAYSAPSVAPGGRLLCVQAHGVTDHLHLYDLERPQGPGTRLTFQGDNACPVFAPDGARIAFRSTLSGRPELYVMGVDPSGPGRAEPVFGSDLSPTPCAFLPGAGRTGGTLLFTQARAGGGPPEIWSVEVGDPATAKPVVQGPAGAWGAAPSPDGRLLAYVSDESGRAEVYVMALPGGARRQVSTEGGCAPAWARAGGELFFRAGPAADAIIAVRIAVEPALMVGRPRPMFQGPMAPPTQHARNYDVLPDGQFLIVRAEEDPARATALDVTLNWTSELARRVPVPQHVGPAAGASRLSSPGLSTPGWLPGSGVHAPHPPHPAHAVTATPSRPAATPARPSYPSEANTIG